MTMEHNFREFDEAVQLLRAMEWPDGHDLSHFLTVAQTCSIVCKEFKIESKNIVIAGLLHDVNDRKINPDPEEKDTKRIIKFIGMESSMKDILTMIHLVSYSKQMNTIDQVIPCKTYQLIPRYADRIEALGWIGLIRSYQYTTQEGKPLINDEDPIYSSRDDMIAEGKKRILTYDGTSTSMISHIYDKIINIPLDPKTCERIDTGSTYLNQQMEKRLGEVIRFLTMLSKDPREKTIHKIILREINC